MGKRCVGLLICLALCVCTLFASHQQLFHRDSDVYRSVSWLCQIAGVAGPGGVSPASASQLKQAMDRIPIGAVPPALREEYYRIEAMLEEGSGIWKQDGLVLDLEPRIATEMKLAGTLSNRTARTESLFSETDAPGILEGEGEVWIDDFLYGSFVLAMRRCPGLESYPFDAGFLFKGLGMENHQPYKAILSVGGDAWNIAIGRDRAGLGKGITGTLTIGDNFLFQEYVRGSFFKGILSYDFLMLHYEQEKPTLVAEDGQRQTIPKLESSRHYGPQQLSITHRLSLTCFNKLSVSALEGLLMQAQNGLDIRMFFPLMILHNYYTFRNEPDSVNNYMSFELDYTFLPGWNFYAEVMIDQIESREERNGANPNNLSPDAWGILSQVSYVMPLKQGMIKLYGEGVYTSPYLYLKESEKDGSLNWNHDLIVGQSLRNLDDISYLGYVHGPDAIVATLGAIYNPLKNWEAEASLTYSVHGEKGMPLPGYLRDRSWEKGVTAREKTTPSFTPGVTLPEHTVQMIVSGRYEVMTGLELCGAAGYVAKWNFRNIPGDRWNDLQLSVTVKIDPLALFLPKV